MKQCEPFVLLSAGKTVTGNVRSLNEDAFVDIRSEHIWAVADGMGGHQSGDFASNLIVQSLGVLRQDDSLEQTIDNTANCLSQVNAFLVNEAVHREGEQTIGSTVVVFIVHEQRGAVLWMGDSRLYRLRNGELKQLTRDHSRVQELVDLGVIEEKDAEAHPMANVITRAIGASEPVNIEIEHFDINSGDSFLLCSDGLYREIDDSEIHTSFARGDCNSICESLIDMLLKGECRDNATAIVIKAIACEETVLRPKF